MTRTTVKAGNYWIEVQAGPNGWEISAIPIRDNPAGTPSTQHVVGTYTEMLQWVLTHTGQYVMEAIRND